MKSRAQRPTLRVAIIGAGRMGYWHGRAARRFGAEIVGIADPNAERVGGLARALQAESTSADAVDFLKAKRIDAVHICSPLSTHDALARRSIECGIHALVEKPLANSAKDTRALFELAREKDVILCPVHQMAFQEGVTYATRVLPGLGELSAIDIRVCSAGGVGRTDEELDEIVGEILPHPLSILRRLWPEAAWQPGLWLVTHPRPGELQISGQHAGALLSIVVSMGARPTCFDMMVHGGSGTIQLDFFHGFALRLDGRVSRAHKVLHPFSAAVKLFGIASINLFNRAIRAERAYPGLRELIQAFYAATRGEKPSPISAEEAVAVASARDFILAVAASRDRREGRFDSVKSAQ